MMVLNWDHLKAVWGGSNSNLGVQIVNMKILIVSRAMICKKLVLELNTLLPHFHHHCKPLIVFGP